MQERRSAERLHINLNARWETLRTQGRGAICDLSSSGCFVLSGSEVNAGELIRLEINLAQEMASLWGQVVYTVAEIGFALRFGFGNESDRQALDRLIETFE